MKAWRINRMGGLVIGIVMVASVITSAVPARAAATTIARGTIMLPSAGGVQPEVLPFVQGECKQSKPDGTLSGFVNIAAYSGRQLRFVINDYDAGGQPVFDLDYGATCGPTAQSVGATGGPAPYVWIARGVYLAISVTTITVNARYTLQVL